MTTSKKDFFIAAAPLLLVLFIDSMGLGLVFPLLNAMMIDPNVHFLPATMSETIRNALYGITIGIFMFCWFFGAAFLGNLSDQIGRKKALLICLLGAFLGYLFSAIAVHLNNLSLLIFGRIIAGFTAGSQSIAQAAIVDISTEEHKARNLGMMLFIISLGFVFGPLAGGVLSDTKLLSFFSYATPFYFAATISLLNAILLWFFFNETFIRTDKLVLQFSLAFSIFFSAFKNEKVRELSIILLVMLFGWSGFYTFISVYLLRIYQFDVLQTGIYMGLMGLGFGIGSGFLVDPLTKRVSLPNTMILGVLLTALCISFILFAPTVGWIWWFIAPLGATITLAYSVLLTLFSDQVDADSQGWIMGITGSIQAFAFAFNALFLGFLSNLAASIPIIFSLICLLLSAIAMKVLFINKQKKSSALPS